MPYMVRCVDVDCVSGLFEWQDREEGEYCSG